SRRPRVRSQGFQSLDTLRLCAFPAKKVQNPVQASPKTPRHSRRTERGDRGYNEHHEEFAQDTIPACSCARGHCSGDGLMIPQTKHGATTHYKSERGEQRREDPLWLA